MVCRNTRHTPLIRFELGLLMMILFVYFWQPLKLSRKERDCAQQVRQDKILITDSPKESALSFFKRLLKSANFCKQKHNLKVEINCIVYIIVFKEQLVCFILCKLQRIRQCPSVIMSHLGNLIVANHKFVLFKGIFAFNQSLLVIKRCSFYSRLHKQRT